MSDFLRQIFRPRSAKTAHASGNRSRHRHPAYLRGQSRGRHRGLQLESLEQRAMLAITIDWVTVGDPGNAPDPATGFGAVDAALHARILDLAGG